MLALRAEWKSPETNREQVLGSVPGAARSLKTLPLRSAPRLQSSHSRPSSLMLKVQRASSERRAPRSDRQCLLPERRISARLMRRLLGNIGLRLCLAGLRSPVGRLDLCAGVAVQHRAYWPSPNRPSNCYFRLRGIRRNFCRPSRRNSGVVACTSSFAEAKSCVPCPTPPSPQALCNDGRASRHETVQGEAGRQRPDSAPASVPNGRAGCASALARNFGGPIGAPHPACSSTSPRKCGLNICPATSFTPPASKASTVCSAAARPRSTPPALLWRSSSASRANASAVQLATQLTSVSGMLADRDPQQSTTSRSPMDQRRLMAR